MSDKIIQIKDGSDNALPVSNESSSNYCKMPDGTLIQWGLVNITTATSGSGAWSYYGSKQVAFPIPFSETPACFSNVLEYAAYWTSGIASRSATGLTAQLAGNTNNAAKDVLWLAVGRWK